jgi:hypothetical protein
MATYNVSKSYPWHCIGTADSVSDKVAAVCRMFGVTADRLTETRITVNCKLEINDGDIVYITGPSGSGKTILLKELEKSVPACKRVNLAQIKLSADKTVIDCIDADFLTSLRVLSKAGLSDVFCILNQPTNLSDGQKYRLRLAKALAAGKKFIFADEFCCQLDRITAAVISAHIHKFAKRNGVIFILAASHEDILADLQPDVIVSKELSGQTEVIYKYNR